MRRKLQVAITISFLPVSYLLALMTGDIAFTRSDQFFMQQTQTLSRISTLYAVYLAVVLAFAVYVVFSGKPEVEAPKVEQTLKSVKFWLAVIPPALIFTVWIFVLVQWEYITNQYSFMLSEARLFSTYMVIGSTLATSTFTLSNALRFKYHISLIGFLLA
jgi:hypothetical protein